MAGLFIYLFLSKTLYGLKILPFRNFWELPILVFIECNFLLMLNLCNSGLNGGIQYTMLSFAFWIISASLLSRHSWRLFSLPENSTIALSWDKWRQTYHFKLQDSSPLWAPLVRHTLSLALSPLPREFRNKSAAQQTPSPNLSHHLCSPAVSWRSALDWSAFQWPAGTAWLSVSAELFPCSSAVTAPAGTRLPVLHRATQEPIITKNKQAKLILTH